VGGLRIGPLILNSKKLPRGNDLAVSIANELIVSSRLSEIIRRSNVTGVEFAKVYSPGISLIELLDWRDPVVQYQGAVLTSATRVGDRPFLETSTESGACRCGQLLGLNLLSEPWIAAETRGTEDVIQTSQFIGVRRGVLRPRRLTLVSPKVREVFLRAKVKGFRLEVAHIVK
jgi:hypothetical protein